ncbi:M48 family metallopeptidase [Spiroplasma endosymbiont of Glossina fuscipes fuscipes]|uniref:M48 family metallopeptidase n=1 Tax=Spiroplasma endosymbiont of Glossina fuscipes fuscipes TaxID=2004463 RepID=UPI003C738AE3
MAFQKVLPYQGNLIKYDLIIKEQKNIVLNVNNGKIKVSAPSHAHDWEIEALIYKNIKKIITVMDVHDNYRKIVINPDGTGYVFVFNEKYPLQLTTENVHTKIINRQLFLMKDAGSYDENVKKLHQFLKQKFGYKFEQLLDKWATTMGLTYKNLSVKVMTRKWGVCYPQTEKIVLNTKLIHFDPTVLEYVIVHELSHLVHHNHSKPFWYYIERYMPNYQEKVEILKKPGI